MNTPPSASHERVREATTTQPILVLCSDSSLTRASEVDTRASGGDAGLAARPENDHVAAALADDPGLRQLMPRSHEEGTGHGEDISELAWMDREHRRRAS